MENQAQSPIGNLNSRGHGKNISLDAFVNWATEPRQEIPSFFRFKKLSGRQKFVPENLQPPEINKTL